MLWCCCWQQTEAFLKTVFVIEKLTNRLIAKEKSDDNDKWDKRQGISMYNVPKYSPLISAKISWEFYLQTINRQFELSSRYSSWNLSLCVKLWRVKNWHNFKKKRGKISGKFKFSLNIYTKSLSHISLAYFWFSVPFEKFSISKHKKNFFNSQLPDVGKIIMTTLKWKEH